MSHDLNIPHLIRVETEMHVDGVRGTSARKIVYTDLEIDPEMPGFDKARLDALVERTAQALHARPKMSLSGITFRTVAQADTVPVAVPVKRKAA